MEAASERRTVGKSRRLEHLSQIISGKRTGDGFGVGVVVDNANFRSPARFT